MIAQSTLLEKAIEGLFVSGPLAIVLAVGIVVLWRAYRDQEEAADNRFKDQASRYEDRLDSLRQEKDEQIAILRDEIEKMQRELIDFFTSLQDGES